MSNNLLGLVKELVHEGSEVAVAAMNDMLEENEQPTIIAPYVLYYTSTPWYVVRKVVLFHEKEKDPYQTFCWNKLLNTVFTYPEEALIERYSIEYDGLANLHQGDDLFDRRRILNEDFIPNLRRACPLKEDELFVNRYHSPNMSFLFAQANELWYDGQRYTFDDVSFVPPYRWVSIFQ